MRRAAIATVTLVAALGGLALAGCGSSSPAISEDASRQLQLQVAAVRNAAEARDRARADQALGELRRTAADLRSRDEISESRFSKVLDAATAVEAQLQSIPTTTTTTTTTVPPTTREPDEDRRKGENGGKGGDGGGGD